MATLDRPLESSSLDRLKIVVVDDNVDFADSLVDVLSDGRDEVIAVFDGRSAIEECTKRRCDVLIVDIGLPDVPGLEVAERVRKTSDDLDVVVVTGHATVETAAAAVGTAASAYLEKPIDVPTLRSVIDAVRRRRTLQRENNELQAELDRINAGLMSVFDAIPLPIAVANDEGVVQAVNETLCAVFGTEPHLLVGKRDLDVLFGPGAVVEDPIDRPSILSGSTQVFERDDLAATGTFSVSCASIPDATTPHLVYTLTEITEIKRAEQTLRLKEVDLQKSQNREIVGRLASGIAHDFNNVLMAVNGYAELARDASDPQLVSRSLAAISAASLRAAELTSQLLALSRDRVIETTPVDVNMVLRTVSDMMRRVIPSAVELRAVYADGLPTVMSSSAQLEQVVTNLVLNAGAAIEEYGVIEVSTEHVAFEHDAFPRGAVRLTISDDGRGIDPKSLDQIFEPFYTTKAVGEGSGLGLSMVRGIVEQNDGFIEVSSELGVGTTFAIHLPAGLASDQILDVSAATSGDAGYEGTESILVVEDDDAVRAVLNDLLVGSGYSVQLAVDGNEGWRHLENVGFDNKNFDLVVSDVIMPGMSGIELSDRIEETFPNMPVLLLSGYTDQKLAPGRHILLKPVKTVDLLVKIRALLDS